MGWQGVSLAQKQLKEKGQPFFQTLVEHATWPRQISHREGTANLEHEWLTSVQGFTSSKVSSRLGWLFCSGTDVFNQIARSGDLGSIVFVSVFEQRCRVVENGCFTFIKRAFGRRQREEESRVNLVQRRQNTRLSPDFGRWREWSLINMYLKTKSSDPLITTTSRHTQRRFLFCANELTASCQWSQFGCFVPSSRSGHYAPDAFLFLPWLFLRVLIIFGSYDLTMLSSLCNDLQKVLMLFHWPRKGPLEVIMTESEFLFKVAKLAWGTGLTRNHPFFLARRRVNSFINAGEEEWHHHDCFLRLKKFQRE